MQVLDKRSEEDIKKDEEVKENNTNELKVLKQFSKISQLLLASEMTVYEERYSAYFNAIKAIWKEANTRNGKKGNTYGQEDKKKK